METFTISSLDGDSTCTFFVFLYAIIGVPILSVLFLLTYMNKFSDDPDFMSMQDQKYSMDVKIEDSVLSDIQIKVRTV